ncbi:bleomycin resistance protein [Leucobacter sp. OLJS4]|uniref:VOC family protein n=1 Tax=unclassified Leucobacter TaxID=2621730 RepID=UPI000C17B8B2|nr:MULTISPECIES: VOC family protein [unclassified Leucobacter]PIJ49472.1 bleomycin resistance protein [Leucobacter sp. OLES1]PII82357.1 bleomycin resistance protein [Leucobacter sp. OLCALW19]PII87463.1 bleomycin resistance protein [Leucobacter sp. OLTLW20]PII94480.1 bleomycin resistance protein [Leucobacter sp. OLAS13]PIJ00721.1 bleomycin resistance protein [Leucobacter sp. OLDS2]
MTLQIRLTQVFVTDQERAKAFYTEKLGFLPKHDIPVGDARWITVVSAADPEGTELLLEPNQHPAAQAYTAALLADGIPAAQFAVEDVAAEHARLTALGVRFTQDPAAAGPVTTAVLDDTCGNLIQLMHYAG